MTYSLLSSSNIPLFKLPTNFTIESNLTIDSGVVSFDISDVVVILFGNGLPVMYSVFFFYFS